MKKVYTPRPYVHHRKGQPALTLCNNKLRDRGYFNFIHSISYRKNILTYHEVERRGQNMTI